MNVPLLDLKAQFAPIADEIRDAIDRVVRSQIFVLGEEVSSLEDEVAAYTGATHAIGCASGTDALILALAGLDIGPGDRVLTTPFSFFATASCAYKVGARPSFADIDPETFNLDVDAVDDAIDGSTRALLPVHLFGQCADMTRLTKLAARHELPLIEDSAQALGARYRLDGVERHAGAMGAVGCYSFFPTKNLGGFGDGGMMVTSDGDLADKLRQLRVHGGQQMYRHRWVGWNSRLDALQAAVLRIKLPHLDRWSTGRRENADRYDAGLAAAGLVEKGAVRLPVRTDDAFPIFNQYVLRVERRDALRDHLNQAGIGHSVYYPVALHLQECFAELDYRQGEFPVAEQACKEVIALPVYPELGAEQQERVIAELKAFYD
ncbi:MAG: DegT/DnrJ/EryC1/StrS family aminotransferase [Acidobacteriota bacterium]|nr:DegT/DnrJ/EryC1/StrS family aminotransferase [Acidobacteriota bacterium]MDH3784168.1 DegT/DnrJ/EryC1/StrS family aminotransferase [Acidobacteriota bacterium]